MIKHSSKHYENYQHGIKRAKALVIVQRTIDKFLNGEIDVEGYLSELMGAVGFGGNFFGEIGETVQEQFEEKIKPKEDDVIAFKPDVKKIEELLTPIIEGFEALETISSSPLYYEAVVVAVTSFEVYLRDTLIELVSENNDIEDKFHEILQNKVDYRKLKDHRGVKPELAYGRIVAKNYDFFNVEDINKAYQRILGKNAKIISKKKEIQDFMELRHIIIHNRGIMDQKYLKATKKKHKEGEPFPISMTYVEKGVANLNRVVRSIEKGIDSL
ncbi:MAG: hypothetical protein DRP08_04500 [Candidatus Aenigmatarchaeota archaeon]|nr:MAG: hypothetical protein DRP08_04500 [Candidatus Aenigmarchaeota archaeon]